MNEFNVLRLISKLLSGVLLAFISAACGGSGGDPTAPSLPTGPTYTISGTIGEYRGGPILYADVTAFALPPARGQTHVFTDAQGHYSLSSPSTGPVFLQFGKSGYSFGFKTNVSPENSTLNFVLDRSFVFHGWFLSGPNETVAGSISGDQFLPGDDLTFGGLCEHTACRLVDVSSGPSQTVQIRRLLCVAAAVLGGSSTSAGRRAGAILLLVRTGRGCPCGLLRRGRWSRRDCVRTSGRETTGTWRRRVLRVDHATAAVDRVERARDRRNSHDEIRSAPNANVIEQDSSSRRT